MIPTDIKILDSFVSGSRVYGTPNEDSDIDLVLLVEDSAKLWEVGGKDNSVRFGNLNLVVFTDKEKFKEWEMVTYKLFVKRPVSRDEAVDAFQEAGSLSLPEKIKLFFIRNNQ